MENIKKFLVFLGLLFIGLIGVYLYKRYQKPPQISFFTERFFDSSKREINLSSYKGNPFIVTFYASWCGDCIKELKELNAIKQSELSSIPVVCITDESFEKLLSFEQKKKYPFVFCKSIKSFNELRIHSIPVTYLINADGTVVYQHVGALNWTDNSFLQFAKNLLH